ncbi:SDR family NAD(P)-dependent oxidoreductase [Phytoactinopolyspora endophytica]|uniref:SDR family NAD(P)-dependent oxidoreductase n=1 Tax=Phytoactinopolyspora endophytica TaxID=1642495 RepID=UPI00101D8C8C|nr:SDR family NAD(P)-dependent oxidoreductase [Phytoactinopolyspora endophytica]
MKNIVVAGGTTGMGRGVAMHYLRAGGRVTVIGSDSGRGRAFLDEAAEIGAADRAEFIRADLISVAENRRVIKEIKARNDSLDGLVLTAIRHFHRREETVDGFESTFALYYVSRFLLSYGLTELLEKGGAPVIVNICGIGITKGRVHWEDLTLGKRYGSVRAMLQGGRATDLLGVGYADHHPGGRTRYVLYHPGFTDSGTATLKQPAKAFIKTLARFFARPVEKSIRPVIELMDNPPDRPLIASDSGKPVSLSLSTLDADDARRLYGLTEHLLRP